MNLQIVRHPGDPTRLTLGVLYLDSESVCVTVEPPLRGEGMVAMPEGTYDITLSYDPVLDRPMPYAIGVPVYGAVMLGYEMRKLGEPDDTFVRFACQYSGDVDMEQHTKDDMLVFDVLMETITDAMPEVSIEVMTREPIFLTNKSSKYSRI